MGTDIEAWVEVRELEIWAPVVDAGCLIGRNYDLFGCLFGVANYANFRPLFPDRGLPADASERCRTAMSVTQDPDVFGHTWAAYEELLQIDYSEEALNEDSRIHVYEVQADGRERFVTKALYTPQVEPYRNEILERGEVRVGNEIYRAERMTRQEALSPSPGFAVLLEIMGLLAGCYGRENVRLLACFDP